MPNRDEEQGETATVVHEADDRFTGLYDAHGMPLVRERPQMGFRVKPKPMRSPLPPMSTRPS